MSKHLSKKFIDIEPYVPGEQPQDKKYIKLNTNENPFSLPFNVRFNIYRKSKRFKLYSDPQCTKIREKLSSMYSVSMDNIMMTNGSDEGLNFLFQAYCEKGCAFADITYGFYKVFAKLYGLDFEQIPLREDYTIAAEDYYNLDKTIFIANPNAPTGSYLTLDEIEGILMNNENSLVVVDEAYVDFGAESAVRLVNKYSNLVVVQTFSKSRFMAGLRLGAVFADKEIISELNVLRYSTNPYNVNSAALCAGYEILKKEDYRIECSKKIIQARDWTTVELKKIGFDVIDSKANFIFATNDNLSGEDLYLKLKSKGILVRHFHQERIKDFVRISIGKKSDMKKFINATKKILSENQL